MVVLRSEDGGKLISSRDNELSPNVARIRKNVGGSRCKEQSTKAKSSSGLDNSYIIQQ